VTFGHFFESSLVDGHDRVGEPAFEVAEETVPGDTILLVEEFPPPGQAGLDQVFRFHTLLFLVAGETHHREWAKVLLQHFSPRGWKGIQRLSPDTVEPLSSGQKQLYGSATLPPETGVDV